MGFIVVGQYSKAELDDLILLAFRINMKLTPKSLQLPFIYIFVQFTTILAMVKIYKCSFHYIQNLNIKTVFDLDFHLTYGNIFQAFLYVLVQTYRK